MIKNLILLIFVLAMGWILLSIDTKEKEVFVNLHTAESEIAAYRPGIYIGRGKGFFSDIIIEVEIISIEEKPYFYIERIDILESEEIERYFKPAKSEVVSTVIKKQTAEVDVVTAATRSRDGLLEAIKDALSKAYKGS